MTQNHHRQDTLCIFGTRKAHICRFKDFDRTEYVVDEQVNRINDSQAGNPAKKNEG